MTAESIAVATKAGASIAPTLASASTRSSRSRRNATGSAWLVSTTLSGRDEVEPVRALARLGVRLGRHADMEVAAVERQVRAAIGLPERATRRRAELHPLRDASGDLVVERTFDVDPQELVVADPAVEGRLELELLVRPIRVEQPNVDAGRPGLRRCRSEPASPVRIAARRAAVDLGAPPFGAADRAGRFVVVICPSSSVRTRRPSRDLSGTAAHVPRRPASSTADGAETPPPGVLVAAASQRTAPGSGAGSPGGSLGPEDLLLAHVGLEGHRQLPRLQALEEDLRARGDRHREERADDPADGRSDEEADEDEERRDADGVAHDDRHDDVRLQELDDE